MKEKDLIKSDDFFSKMKRKIFELINKIKKKTKMIDKEVQQEKIEDEEKINKQEILELYKKAKKQEVDLHTIGIKKLKMLVKLAEEEVSILKHKYENEITQQKINEREIEYYTQKLRESKS